MNLINMLKFPKFFICENLILPESTFVIHINYPKFMIDLIDEKIIWIEDNLDEYTKLEFRNIISEAIDWGINETNMLNNIRISDVNSIKKSTEFDFIKKFN